LPALSSRAPAALSAVPAVAGLADRGRAANRNRTPTIAYTHASFFVAFKALGIRDMIRGHGGLLASLADMSNP
jgi:hypothetical protein